MRALPLVIMCGCFGSGPTPTEATGAQILFTLPLGPIVEEDCQPRPYIGAVALGDTFGFAITHTYLPECGGGQGPPDPQLPVAVFEFPKLEGPHRPLDEMAGQTGIGGGGKPRIAAFGDEAVWAFTPTEGMTETELRSKTGTITGVFGSTTRGAAGLVIDATHTYIAGSESTGPAQINNPHYPCCGGDGAPPPQGGNTFVQVTNTMNTTPITLAATPTFNCEHVKDCLVGNSTALFYLENGGQSTPVIRRAKPTLDAAIQIGEIAVGRPGGIAANDSHVAWSITRNFVTPIDPDRCTIFVTAVDAVMGAEQEVFTTNRFSCLDVALDATHVYFAILELVQFEDQSDGLLSHVGIGRVPIGGGMPETLDLGIIGPQAAPRGVFVDGDDLVLMTPFVVAKLPKDALAGRRDVEF